MRRLISKTLHKDQLMLLLIIPKVSVSGKFGASSPGLSRVFLSNVPGQTKFFCIDLSGSADHFLFPQNKCAYFLCVNLTPPICAIYLTLHFMFNFQYYLMYHLVFLTDFFFVHISVNLKTVFKISQMGRNQTK